MRNTRTQPGATHARRSARRGPVTSSIASPASAARTSSPSSHARADSTYLGRAADLDADEIAAARRFEAADPRSAAILAFAAAVLRTRGGVADADVQAARDASLTDGELGDVVGHVALNVLTNDFNRAFDVEVDFPVVEPRLHAAV